MRALSADAEQYLSLGECSLVTSILLLVLHNVIVKPYTVCILPLSPVRSLAFPSLSLP